MPTDNHGTTRQPVLPPHARTAPGVFIIPEADEKAGTMILPSAALPDPSAGDAQFLVDDPARAVQLRPVLQYERPDRKVTPRDRLLVCRTADNPFGTPLHAFVWLKPFERDNTPRNVRIADAKVERMYPTIGAIFRRALTVSETTRYNVGDI